MKKISIIGSVLLGIVLNANACQGSDVIKNASNTPMKISEQEQKTNHLLNLYETIFGKRKDYDLETRKANLKMDCNPFSLKPFHLEIDYFDFKKR